MSKRDGPAGTARGLAVYAVAMIAGALAGLVGGLFRDALVLADEFRISLVTRLHEWPAVGWLVPVVMAAVAVMLARLIVIRVPEAAGSGVQRIEAQVRHQTDSDPLRVVPAKFIGGVLAIGSGLALGREGPTIQMAAAIGGKCSRILKLVRDDQLTIQSALAGAGLGVAFNAPLGGVIFVVEELTKSIRMRVIAATLLATATAVGVMRLMNGGSADFFVANIPELPPMSYVGFVVFGLLVGFGGALYSKTIVLFLDLFAKFDRVPLLVRAGIVGGAIGLLGWFLPAVVGGGDNLTQEMLIGAMPLAVVFGVIVIRWFLGPLSYSIGTPGGLFAPLLVLGAALGTVFAGVLGLISSDLFGDPVAYALVGMAALFAAVVRAPITGIALVVEMTAVNGQFVPILLATGAATITAGLTGSEPIYDTLRHRMLASPAATPGDAAKA